MQMMKRQRQQTGRLRLWSILVAGGVAVLAAGVVLVRGRSRTAPVSGIRFEENVEIARPPEEVFAFVADPRNDAQWTPAIEEGAQDIGRTARRGNDLRAGWPISGSAPPGPLRDRGVRSEPEDRHQAHLRSVATDGQAHCRGRPGRHAAHHRSRGTYGWLLLAAPRSALRPPGATTAKSFLGEPQGSPGSAELERSPASCIPKSGPIQRISWLLVIATLLRSIAEDTAVQRPSRT